MQDAYAPRIANEATEAIDNNNEVIVDIDNEATEASLNDNKAFKALKVRDLAERLRAKLRDSGDNIGFYYRICWRYPESNLMRLAGLAQESRATNKAAYFNALVQAELGYVPKAGGPNE